MMMLFSQNDFSGYLYSGKNISRSHYFSYILDVFQRTTSIISHVQTITFCRIACAIGQNPTVVGWSLSFYTPRVIIDRRKSNAICKIIEKNRCLSSHPPRTNTQLSTVYMDIQFSVSAKYVIRYSLFILCISVR